MNGSDETDKRVMKNMLGMLKGKMKRPTSYENKIINLIKEYNLPYKYCGNGSVIIGYKNPDFINCNNDKILIEVYEEFWHLKDYEEKRSKLFNKYGYKTIFISGRELNKQDWKQYCVDKIIRY